MRLPRILRKKTAWECKHLDTREKVSARQERITGWDQKKMAGATGLFVGAGGINGEICEGAILKGLGVAHVVDFDTVTPSNLNRQKFNRKNLYKNKAIELCRNMSRRGSLGSKLIPHPCSFQDLNIDNLEPRPDFAVIGVDNQFPETRLEACEAFYLRNIPCIILGVTTDADKGYVLVQEPGKACWNCIFKIEMESAGKESDADRCPGVPACVDILKVIGGIALYAIDTLLMNRERNWNYWYVSLCKSDLGTAMLVDRRTGCAVCKGECAE